MSGEQAEKRIRAGTRHRAVAARGQITTPGRKKRSAGESLARFNRILVSLFVLSLLAAGGWCLYWLHLSDRISTSLDRWAEARRAEGYFIAGEAPAIRGFPFAMRLRLRNIAITAPRQLWEWRAERVDLALNPLRPRDIRFDASGRHALALTRNMKRFWSAGGDFPAHQGVSSTTGENAFPLSASNWQPDWTRPAADNSPVPEDQELAEKAKSFLAPGRQLPPRPAEADIPLTWPFSLDFGRLHGRVVWSGSGMARLESRISGLNGSWPVSDSFYLDRLDLDLEIQPEEQRPVFPGDGIPTLQADLSLALNSLDLPDSLTALPGPVLDGARLQARIGGIPPDSRIDGPLAALQAWQQRNGHVSLDQFEILWNTLELRSRGTLAPGPDLYPSGRLEASMRGFDSLVRSLVAGGFMSPKGGALARVALGMMARTPPDGGPPASDVPLFFQRGRFSLGPVTLLDLSDSSRENEKYLQPW